MTDGPNKTSGQYHSTKGNMKESLGNMTGADRLQRHGREEHAEGETEYNAARAKGYAEGTQDRAVGYKDSVVGAVTGDKSQQSHGNARKQQGHVEQDVNRKA